jgi:hypothetical protein
MKFSITLLGIFAAVFFIIVILPMLFIGSYTVGSKETESLGISGLLEGMQKNYIIFIILLIIAINVAVIWMYVILQVTPK